MGPLSRLLGLCGTALVYLGSGALLHAVFVGPAFAWDSAWTWGWLLAWPLALALSLWALWVAILFAIAVGTVFFLIWEACRG